MAVFCRITVHKPILVNPSVWGKALAFSVNLVRRPPGLSSPWNLLWGSSPNSLPQHPLPWVPQHMLFSCLEGRVLDLGALHCTLPPPFCSLSPGFRNWLLNDPACITLKSTQLPKGSLLPNPCPPEWSTLNSAKITVGPLTLKNRQPIQARFEHAVLVFSHKPNLKTWNPPSIKSLKS